MYNVCTPAAFRMPLAMCCTVVQLPFTLKVTSCQQNVVNTYVQHIVYEI